MFLNVAYSKQIGYTSQLLLLLLSLLGLLLMLPEIDATNTIVQYIWYL